AAHCRARRAAGRKDVRADRHAGIDDARGGDRDPRTAWRQGRRIGQQEDERGGVRQRRREQTREGAPARCRNLGRPAVPGEYNERLMSRRFTLVTLALTAVVAFLVGAIVAGGVVRSAVSAGVPATAAAPPRLARASAAPAAGALVNFADVVERLNPAVV